MSNVTNLQRIRESRNISKQELSELSGINKRTIQSYEQRERNINNAVSISLYQLSIVLKCTIEDLLEVENDNDDINFKIEKVFERDVDLLLSQSFMNDDNFINIFLNKIDCPECKVISVEHSVTDVDGESDLRIILESNNQKIALFIEDKIDAIAMPNQFERYNTRAIKGKNDGLYDKYYIFMVAPQDYLNNNQEAIKYPNNVSYEELEEYYKFNNSYGYNIISSALERKKKGYSVIEDKNVTEFWRNYYDYVKTNYPKLRMYEVKGARGANANWPAFLPPIKGVRIQHKSDRGYLDLEFARIANFYYEFSNVVNESLDEDMTIVRTGKSLSIRLLIPIMDFKQDFFKQIDKLEETCIKAMRLYNLLNKLDMPKIIELMNNDYAK